MKNIQFVSMLKTVFEKFQKVFKQFFSKWKKFSKMFVKKYEKILHFQKKFQMK